MINEDDRKFMRVSEFEVQQGRTVKPGDFYLVKRALVSFDPFTHEPTYTTTTELNSPVVQVLKGDEHEIVSGMEIAAGDLICTFTANKAIPTEEPTTTGGFCYPRVKYLDEYFHVLRVWPKGFGDKPNRKILFATKVQ